MMTPMSRSSIALLSLAVTAGVLLLACNTSKTPAGQTSATPATAKTTRSVSFHVCQRNATWQRPTGVWNDPAYRRFSGWGKPYQGNFFQYLGSQSLAGPFESMSGISDNGVVNAGECGTPTEQHDRVVRGQAIEVWLLLYTTDFVEQASDGYVVHVHSTVQGYEMIQWPIPDPSERTPTIRFIGSDSKQEGLIHNPQIPSS